MFKRASLIAVVLINASVPVFAAERTLVLDGEATRVSFTLGAAMHTVHGSVAVSGGEIRFDLETGVASGEVILDATAAETGNNRRDIKMHEKVLESRQYPEIVFRPERVEGQLAGAGESDIVLHGVISIHGTDHPLALEATVSLDGEQLSAQSTFVVPFVQWGMNDPSGFLLKTKKHVDVTLEVRGILK